MYRPKKDPALQPFILQCQEDLPRMADMHTVLAEAQRTNVRPVEMRFLKPNTDIHMTLSVACPNVGEPVWVLSQGQHRDVQEIWTYPCGDVAFVHNLVIAECTGNTADIGAGAGDNKLGGGGANLSSGMLGLSQVNTGGNLTAVASSMMKATKVATMEGDLADMQVPNLLQSLAMGKMTGRLFVDSQQSAAELFFDDGNLVHATALEERGESAISELVTWERGKFYFYRDEKSTEQSVVKRLDFILMESLTLLDQSKALLKGGIKMDSYLQKKNPSLSEGEFETRVRNGVPADLAMQKNFYIRADGSRTVGDMIKDGLSSKAVWVPILFNMMTSDLLVVAARSTVTDKTAGLPPTPLDRVGIEQVTKSLARPDTGIMSYTSFQYFLEQEFFRFERHQIPFTVMLFDMGYLQQNRLMPFSTEALGAAIGPINTAKRQLDIFAHFETLSYGVLMPHTEPAAAAILANRIMEMLRSTNLGPINPQYLAFAFGIAAMPEDCRDINLLLSAAKAAKLSAQRTNVPVVLWKDLKR